MNNQNLVEDIKSPQKTKSSRQTQPDINDKSASNITDFNTVLSKSKKSNKSVFILICCLIIIILISLVVIAYLKSPHN